MAEAAVAHPPSGEPQAADVIDLAAAAEKRKRVPEQTNNGRSEGAKILRFQPERGGNNESVGLTAEARVAMSRHVQDRYQVAQDLDNDPSKPRLNEYDRLLLDRGKDFIDKVAGGEPLTNDELAIAWSIITDELVQKASVTRVELNTTTGRHTRLREIFGERRVVGGIVDRFAEPDTVAVATAEGPHFKSAYLDKLGYESWDPATRAQDLLTLNQLRESVGSQLGLTSAGEVPELREKSGDRIHDAQVEAVNRILARDHEGVTLLELQDQDPMQAALVRQRALQEGLTAFAKDSAIALLKSEGERPKIDTESIQAHIDNLSSKASESRLDALRETKSERDEASTESKDKYNALREELRTSKAEVARASLDRAQAEAARDAQNPLTVGGGIRQIDAQIFDLQREIANNSNDARALDTSGMRPEAIATEKAKYAQLIADARARINTFLDKKSQLDAAVANATARENYYNGRVTAIERSRGGEMARARREMDKARAAQDTAARDLKEGEEGTTPVKAATKGALEQWKKVGEGYDKIIDERFGQRREDRFTAAKLGSTAEIDGQIVGAEKIREHLFRVTDATWWAKEGNSEQARRMLSDEAIAKGIIDTLRIDTGRRTIDIPVVGGGMGAFTYEQCFDQIDARRSALDTAIDALAEERGKGTTGAALTPFETAVTAARNNIEVVEKPLLKDVLPYLQQANEFQIGDVMRKLVRQGLESASDGKPYVNGEEFVRPEAELRIAAESILEEGKGKATFVETNMSGMGEAPFIQWEGELNHVHDEALGFHVDNQELDLTFSVRQELDRYGVEADIDVLINEQFLQALPETIAGMADVPDSIRNLFYDNLGNLRTELRLRDRNTLQRLMESQRQDIDNRGRMWLTVRENINAPASDDMLATLNNELSDGVDVDIAVATANTVLTMSPNERLNVVKGFDIPAVMGYDLLGEVPPRTVGLAVDFDNAGRFWVTETDAAGVRNGERQELEKFLERQEEGYREQLGVQNLNTQQREILQGQYVVLQEAVGREVLLRQQRR